MKVYVYNEETGIFKNEHECQVGLFGETLYPSGTYTTIEPPLYSVGQKPKWNGSGWDIIDDKRNVTIYDMANGEQTICNDFEIPEGYVETAPPEFNSSFQEVSWNGSSWDITSDVTNWLNYVVRPERNRLLDEADIKYCNADLWELMDETTKQSWRDYKMDLRDFPETLTEYTENVTWPQKPS